MYISVDFVLYIFYDGLQQVNLISSSVIHSKPLVSLNRSLALQEEEPDGYKQWCNKNCLMLSPGSYLGHLYYFLYVFLVLSFFYF